MTRFRVRSVLHMPLFYWAFRTIRFEAKRAVPGFVEAVFVLESPRVCYTLSLWENDGAIRDFNKLASHIGAANWAIVRLSRERSTRPELCSFHWHLWAASRNLTWGSLNLHRHVRTGTEEAAHAS